MNQKAIGFFSFISGYFAFIMILLFASTAEAQEKAVITGKITDNKQRPLSGVNVSLFGKPGGVATDQDGRYTFSIQPGTVEIIYSFVGYETKRIKITIGAGERQLLDQQLEVSSTPLPVVDIKDEEFRRTTFTRIDPKVASLIPSASGNFEAVIKSLPGVVSNNELTSQYSVRGGNYDENLVYVNDIEIYRPLLVRSGQQEGLSFINSDLVSQINFSAGGFEAAYGDKLSSVLDIKYRKPLSFAGSASASLMGGALHLEGVSKNKKTGYLVGARYKSNQYLFKSLETKGEYKPSFADVQGLFNWEIGPRTELDVLGNFSFNKYLVVPENRETEFGTINEALRLTIYFDGQEIDEYRTVTGAVSLTHKVTDSLRLKLIASSYRSQESESFDIQGQYYIDELEKDIGSENFGDVAFNRGIGTYIQHARNDLDATVYSIEHKGYLDRKKYALQWGARLQHEIIDDFVSEWEYIDSAEYSLPHPPDNIGGPGDPMQLILLQEVIKTNATIASNRISGYAMNSWFWGNKDKFVLNAGVRANYWDVNDELVISPRLNFTWKPSWTKNLSFRLATGFYYQPPFYRELRDFDGTVHKDVKAQRSIHVIGGADYVFLAWGREFKLVSEAYFKQLDNLVPYKVDNLRIRYFANNDAKGYATGIDFRVNGEFVEGIESWASLSVLKTEEDLKNDYYYTYYNSDGEVIVPGYTFNDTPTDSVRTNPGYIARPADQRLTFSLFFQDYLPKFPTFKMHMTLVFGTGLPFGPPGRDRYKDKLRFPDYRRVDIGFSKILIDEDYNKEYRLKIANKIKYMTVGLEVFNLLQVNNTVSYLWVTDVTNRKYAVPNYLSARTLNLRIVTKF